MADKESLSANDIIAEVDAEVTTQPTETESIEQPENSTEETAPESTGDSPDEDLSGEETSADVADVQEAVDEADQVVEDSDIAEEDKAKAKQEIAQRIYKAKILGQEREFDVSNPEHVKELLDGYQKGLGAYEKFEEAANLRKAADAETTKAKEFYRLLKEDLPALLAHPDLNLDSEYIKEVAEKVLAGKLEEEMLTPEQKRIKELERELEKQKAEADEIRKAEESAKMEEASKHLADKWQEEIKQALSKFKLPDSPKTSLQMIDYMERARAIGHDSFTWEDAAKRVKKDFTEWQNEIYGSVGDDDLDTLIPSKVKERVRKSTVTKAKQAVKKPATPSTKSVSTQSSEPKKPTKKHMDDFLSEIYKEAGLQD